MPRKKTEKLELAKVKFESFKDEFSVDEVTGISYSSVNALSRMSGVTFKSLSDDRPNIEGGLPRGFLDKLWYYKNWLISHENSCGASPILTQFGNLARS